jgi:uncharacterized FlaG/YvyC family protein
MGRTIDTMTIIKSICSGVGALSAVLICASVLWSEMGDLDTEKLDKEVFVEYRVSDWREREEDRRENRNEHDKLFGYVVEINKGMQKLNTNVEILINERDRQ